MDSTLRQYIDGLEALAKNEGLNHYGIDFEQVPESFMMEIAVYGLPIRMPHWSFGVRYIHQLVRHRMGHSRLFEVVFPGDPNRAYLANRNTVEENTLVAAHVIGHSDFAKNNLLFKRSQAQVGARIVEQAAAHARYIADAIESHGEARVELVLDAALALEQHIDLDKGLSRPDYETPNEVESTPRDDEFGRRYAALDDSDGERVTEVKSRALPPTKERDLLWFIAKFGAELEDWERDVFLAVREESFYFYPVFACQIMNEGWACYWHARLLREASFLPHNVYLEAIKSHSDVVRPFAGEQEIALTINPYHLGFKMWEHIIDQHGLDFARKVVAEDDDFGFIRNHLDEDLADQLNLFNYEMKSDGEIRAQANDIDSLRENLLAPKYNFNAPTIAVEFIGTDGSLNLSHDFGRDGRGLDTDRTTKVLEYIRRVWRRPVIITSSDEHGKEQVIECAETA